MSIGPVRSFPVRGAGPGLWRERAKNAGFRGRILLPRVGRPAWCHFGVARPWSFDGGG